MYFDYYYFSFLSVTSIMLCWKVTANPVDKTPFMLSGPQMKQCFASQSEVIYADLEQLVSTEKLALIN